MIFKKSNQCCVCGPEEYCNFMIQSHCIILANEEAEKLAKEDERLPQPTIFKLFAGEVSK